MIDLIAVGVGVFIGCLIEWVVWILRCNRKGLFDENGVLINLRRKKGGK